MGRGHGRSVLVAAVLGSVITVTSFVLSLILVLVLGIPGQKVEGSGNKFLWSNSCESGVDCPVQIGQEIYLQQECWTHQKGASLSQEPD